MSTIDVKYKCFNKISKTKCTCHSDPQVKAVIGKLKGTDEKTNYEYCAHTGSNYIWIKDLNYGGSPLQTDNNGDGKSQLLSAKHPEVWEVTTYYSLEHDNGKTTIKVPLILGVQTIKRADYAWYENSGANGDNLIWTTIKDPDKFPKTKDGPVTTEFIQRLNELTCAFHKLHIVDIHAKDSYNCACGDTRVTVTTNEGETVSGYTKYSYKHEYGKDENPVRYKRVGLKDKEDDFLRLSDLTKDLIVYYWNADKKRKRPLLMEVSVGYISLYYKNDGEQNNEKWTTIESYSATLENGLRFPKNELEDKLQELKCRLFKPAEIDLTKPIGYYVNKYCQDRNCKKKECPDKVTVDNYDSPQYEGFGLDNYTARKHTYRGGNFTIAGLKTDPSKDNNLVKHTIFDVTEVLVLFTKFPKSGESTGTPLMAYIKSGNGAIMRWQQSEGMDNLKSALETVKQQSQTEDDSDDEEEAPYSIVIASKPNDITEVQADHALKPKTTKTPDADHQPGILRTDSSDQVSTQNQDRALHSDASGGSEPASHTPETSDTITTDESSQLAPKAETGPADKGAIGEDAKLPAAVNDEAKETGAGEVLINRAENGESSGLFDWLNPIARDFAGKAVSPFIKLRSVIDSAVGLGITTAPYHLFNGLFSVNKAIAEVQKAYGAQSPVGSRGTETHEVTTTDTTTTSNLLTTETQAPKDTTPQPGQAEAEAQSTSDSIQGTPLDSPLSPPNSNSNTPEIIKTTISVTTGILVTSALACFTGWKLYNHYKGDLWKLLLTILHLLLH